MKVRIEGKDKKPTKVKVKLELKPKTVLHGITIKMLVKIGRIINEKLSSENPNLDEILSLINIYIKLFDSFN